MRRAVVTGGCAAGAAGFAWFHSRYPTSQLYGATIARAPCQSAGRRIALTYDDGPNPVYTPPLLALLERYRAKATFFQIGRWIEREPALAREVEAAGHALGNHTYTHANLAACSGARVKEELRRCRDAAEAAGLAYSTVDGRELMRCPWGRRRPGTLRAARAEGYVPVQWSITCWDWRTRESWQDFARRGLKAKGGDVILLHDGIHTEPAGDRANSLRATHEILERLGAEGYEFVSVPELVAAAG
ncbi:MAG TPA: polysaccharide deacetylase family protein [Thermoleophilaceae bacterium]|nr:polysaccharide deacetylase family protein [Thermoleophilaceae bacterium]